MLSRSLEIEYDWKDDCTNGRFLHLVERVAREIWWSGATCFLRLDSLARFTQPSLSPIIPNTVHFHSSPSNVDGGGEKDTFVLQWPLLNLEEGAAARARSPRRLLREMSSLQRRMHTLSPSLPPVSLRCRSQIGHKDLSKVIICCCSTSLRERERLCRASEGRGDCDFPNAP